MLKSQIEIIYSDKDIVVVNKPTGVSVTKDRAAAPQLAELLAKQLGPEIGSNLQLIDRLDKDASGIMILAKNAETQSMFSNFFEKRLVKKTYLAFVNGSVMRPEGQINAPLRQDPRNTNLMRIDSKKGKEAITDWKLLADFGPVALLAVKPLTGRTHQIRVHLRSIGLPLVIDPIYGNTRPIYLSDFKTGYRLSKGKKEKPLMERLALHAYQIDVPKSKQNRPAVFIAGLDRKFVATIKMLTKHNTKGIEAFTKPDDFQRIINRL